MCLDSDAPPSNRTEGNPQACRNVAGSWTPLVARRSTIVIFHCFMNTQPSRQRGILSLIAVSGLAFAFACNRSEAAPPSKPAPTDSAGAVAGGPKAETDTYAAELKLAGPCKAGGECTFEVTLDTKASYHINKSYPYKFKAADPPQEGVSYPKPILKREDGTFEEKHGSFRVPFAVAKAGKAKVGGTFNLSVCSDANCIMDKVTLESDVDVK